MKRVLLLLPTTGYRNADFLAAANKMGVEILAAANYCHQLAPSWGLPPIMALHFDRPEQAAGTVLRGMPQWPCAGCATSWRFANCFGSVNSCVPNSIACRPAWTRGNWFRN